MGMRLSFSVDPGLVDMVDQYAKNRAIKREQAILELIEAGITHIQEGGTIKIEQCRSFEEYSIIRKQLSEIGEIVGELRGEIHVIHHEIEKDLNEEARVVPFQSKRWWEFWKG
jgi:hypothetical protein